MSPPFYRLIRFYENSRYIENFQMYYLTRKYTCVFSKKINLTEIELFFLSIKIQIKLFDWWEGFIHVLILEYLKLLNRNKFVHL